MIKEFEHKGTWWLPEKPENDVFGTLRFVPGAGATLELLGSLKGTPDITAFFATDVILGRSSDGTEITLQNCIETGASTRSKGASTSTVHATVVFVGAHFEQEQDTKFNRLSVHYSNLDEWVNLSGFGIDNWLGGEDDGQIVIVYEPVETVHVATIDGYDVLIDVVFSGPSLSMVQKEARIAQETYISLQPANERPFSDYFDMIHRIRNLLTLGVGEPVHPLIVRGTTEANKMAMDDGAYYPPVDISYELPDIGSRPKTVLPFQMLFTFADISERSESLFGIWFDNADLLQPVYDLYFGSLYNPHMYLQSRFLSLSQGLESYHRRAITTHELPEEEHKTRTGQILEAVPAKYRDWVAQQLFYSNEPSLRRRLKEILGAYREVISISARERAAFVDQVVATRNYLTHYDESLERQAAKGHQLFYMTQKLRMLLEMCLLTQLGFATTEIKDLFSRNPRRRQELQLWG